MKRPRFLALTFCILVFVAFSALNGASKPALVKNDANTNIALVSGNTFSWTGFYIGGHVGGILNYYQLNSQRIDVDPIQQFDDAFNAHLASVPYTGGPNSFFTPHHGETANSVLGGGQVGFMYQFGQFVVGIEGDGSRLATHAQKDFFATEGSLLTNGTPGEDIFAETDYFNDRRVETDWNASLRARLGWAHGAFLFYATGGVAWADVNLQGNDAAFTTFSILTRRAELAPAQITPPPSFAPFAQATSRNFAQSDDNVYTGWTAGAGVAVAVTDMISVGLEYRHSDFGDESPTLDAHGGPIFPAAQRIDLESDQVTLRFNVSLNHFFGH